MAGQAAIFHALLRPAILQTLRATGYHATRGAVVDSLTDLAARYLRALCEATAAHATHNHGDAGDYGVVEVRLALQDAGALLPECTAAEQAWRGDDVRGVDAFVGWFAGPRMRELVDMARGDGEADAADYLSGEAPSVPRFCLSLPPLSRVPPLSVPKGGGRRGGGGGMGMVVVRFALADASQRSRRSTARRATTQSTTAPSSAGPSTPSPTSWSRAALSPPSTSGSAAAPPPPPPRRLGQTATRRPRRPARAPARASAPSATPAPTPTMTTRWTWCDERRGGSRLGLPQPLPFPPPPAAPYDAVDVRGRGPGPCAPPPLARV